MATSTVRQRKTKDEEPDDIPEDVRAVKEKLERETGKTYRYRPAKKDLPSVPELLQHGSGKPMTWKESIVYPIILAVVFAVSLFIFHHAVLVPSQKAKLEGRGRKAYSIPKMPPNSSN